MESLKNYQVWTSHVARVSHATIRQIWTREASDLHMATNYMMKSKAKAFNSRGEGKTSQRNRFIKITFKRMFQGKG
jgi:hypothetical protein